MISFCLLFTLKTYHHVINRNLKGCLRFSPVNNWLNIKICVAQPLVATAPEASRFRSPFFTFLLFYLFYLFTFSCHARGNAQCGCDGRQNTDCCLNHELPNFLFLFHNFQFLMVNVQCSMFNVQCSMVNPLQFPGHSHRRYHPCCHCPGCRSRQCPGCRSHSLDSWDSCSG